MDIALWDNIKRRYIGSLAHENSLYFINILIKGNNWIELNEVGLASASGLAYIQISKFMYKLYIHIISINFQRNQ